MTLTDIAPLLPLLTHNAAANATLVAAAGGALDVQEFDWAHPPPPLCAQRWDLIIGSDLVYNQAGVDALCTAMRQLLSNAAQGPQSAGKAEHGRCVRGGFHGSNTTCVHGCTSSRKQPALLEVVLAHKQRHEEVDWQLLHGFKGLGVGLAAVAAGEGEGGARVTVYHSRAQPKDP